MNSTQLIMAISVGKRHTADIMLDKQLYNQYDHRESTTKTQELTFCPNEHTDGLFQAIQVHQSCNNGIIWLIMVDAASHTPTLPVLRNLPQCNPLRRLHKKWQLYHLSFCPPYCVRDLVLQRNVT